MLESCIESVLDSLSSAKQVFQSLATCPKHGDSGRYHFSSSYQTMEFTRGNRMSILLGIIASFFVVELVVGEHLQSHIYESTLSFDVYQILSIQVLLADTLDAA